jgi:hypothetical protein
MTLFEQYTQWLSESSDKDAFSKWVDDSVVDIKNKLAARKYRGAINKIRPEAPKGVRAKKEWVNDKARKIGLVK